MSHSDRPTAEQDQIAFSEFVDRAAEMVADGLVEFHELTAKEYHDESDDDLRDAVAAQLDGEGDVDDAVEGGQESRSDAYDDPRSVDWAALWEEFGFDTPDATGSKIISDTQLTAALDVAEQPLQGDAEGHIRNALTQETLLEKRNGNAYLYIGGRL